MTRSYVHQCHDIRRAWQHDQGPGVRSGRVCRKTGASLAREHKGVNNTKYRHHMIMDAMDDPRGNHSYYRYGSDHSLWLYRPPRVRAKPRIGRPRQGRSEELCSVIRSDPLAAILHSL